MWLVPNYFGISCLFFFLKMHFVTRLKLAFTRNMLKCNSDFRKKQEAIQRWSMICFVWPWTVTHPKFFLCISSHGQDLYSHQKLNTYIYWFSSESGYRLDDDDDNDDDNAGHHSTTTRATYCHSCLTAGCTFFAQFSDKGFSLPISNTSGVNALTWGAERNAPLLVWMNL